MKQQLAEVRIEEFIAKYSPEVGEWLRRARAQLRSLFPRGCELVYDNYNALVFAFAATNRTTDAFLSVAGYPRWVTLFFSHGASLDDPGHLLQGSGSRVRSIRLSSAEQLLERPIQALIMQAMEPHREVLLRAGPLQTEIKSVSLKQRPRRPEAGLSPGLK